AQAAPSVAPVKPTVVPIGAASPSPAAALQSGIGMIQILTGPNAGKELELNKNLITLGKAGAQVVVLTKRAQGYFITYVEGSSYPTLNAKPLSDQPHQLKDNDIIELVGVKMEFYIKN
ncbi:MAG: hypothetical protein ABL860_05515, partial [Candidatus Nitrotoga sp.]